jgi:hypothetical protein
MEDTTISRDRDCMPNTREIASESDFQKAKERGERLGFKDIFLDSFIERELIMMQKWNNRRLYEKG